MPTDGTPLICASTVRCVITGTHWGKPFANVIDATYSSTAESTALDVFNNWQDHIYDFLSAGCVPTGLNWTDLDAEDGPTGFLAPNPAKNLVGQQGGDDLPSNASLLAHKNLSGARGTRNGRTYFVGVHDAWVSDDGSVNSTGLGIINPLLENFKDGVNDAAQHFAVIHIPSTIVGGERIYHPSEATQEEVQTFTCDPLVATQRRRLRR